MRRLLLPLLVLLLLPACSGGGPAAAPSSAPSSAPAVPPPPLRYVALGDSVAAGVGAPTRAQGYVGLLPGLLAQRPDRVEDLAVSGATTATVLRDQVPGAQELLRTPGRTLVTLTVGGNDVFRPVLLACALDPGGAGCRSAAAGAVASADRGVAAVLDALDETAGDDDVVAVMTYYDPVPACRLAPLDALARQVLEGDGDSPGLDDVLRARAREHGAVVVETGDLLRVPQDLVGGDDCLHPSGSGHARLAQAFADAVAGPLARTATLPS